MTKKRHQELKNEFQELLRSTNRDGVEDLLEYLERTDFYKAPASTEYVRAYPGGLMEHSLDVYHIMKEKLSPGASMAWDKVAALPYVTDDTIILVSLLHDLYKIGLFTVTSINRRNYSEEAVAKAAPYMVKMDGDRKFVWETAKGYRYDDTLPFGEGEKSVILAMRCVKLTDEEILAIRWHRGYDSDDRAQKISAIFGSHPLALALYTSDMEASFIYNHEDTPAS